MGDAAKFGRFLQGVGRLLEDADALEEFKQRAVIAGAHAAVEMAKKANLPPELVAKLERELGLHD